MDVREIVNELPDPSPVRRLINFLLDDAQVNPLDLANVLGRANEIVRGLKSLEQERYLSSGESEADQQERFEKFIRPMIEVKRDLERLIKRNHH